MRASRTFRVATPALAAGMLLASLWPDPAQGGAWGISPIRVHFDGSSKTAALKVDSTDPATLHFQVRLMRWTQDEHGKDQFEPSEDLLYFPRQFALEPGKQRLIRLGSKQPIGPQETTYRLFVEELPPADERGPGTQVAVRLRFGVPIFFGPAEPAPAAAIRELTIAGGAAHFRVVNTGNQRFLFETVQALAGDTTLGETRGWYLLPGRQRSYRIDLEPDKCAAASRVSVSFSTNAGMDVSRSVAVTPAQCQP